MTRVLFQPQDADQVLADFGADLICAAVPAVTRGLIEDGVVEQAFGEGVTRSKQRVLKVKAGAFGLTKVKDTRVTVVRESTDWNIDSELPHDGSIFDWYALQPVRVRTP